MEKEELLKKFDISEKRLKILLSEETARRRMRHAVKMLQALSLEEFDQVLARFQKPKT